MKKSALFIYFLLLISCLTVYGQDFKGILINASQRPLKGIKVWRKNTTESVKTDKMGVFSFPQIVPTDTIVIAISRKEEIIIPVDRLTQVSIKVGKKNYTLFDGQKETKREYSKIVRTDFNPNILTREQIQKISANNIYDLFKGGSIPGVSVNGDKITIRGGSSFDLDNEPLFVVDGTIYESSGEVDSTISINDIEKVEIQKSAPAYGVRGANGAVIITTTKR